MVERSPTGHYVWGEVCDGWHLVQTPTLSVIEERMPPGAAERRHHHNRAQQFFYVLRGTLIIEFPTTNVVLHVGQGVSIPPGVTHRVHNRSQIEVEFLVVSEPPSHGDRIEVG